MSGTDIIQIFSLDSIPLEIHTLRFARVVSFKEGKKVYVVTKNNQVMENAKAFNIKTISIDDAEQKISEITKEIIS